jgi:hypothetical protein
VSGSGDCVDRHRWLIVVVLVKNGEHSQCWKLASTQTVTRRKRRNKVTVEWTVYFTVVIRHKCNWVRWKFMQPVAYLSCIYLWYHFTEREWAPGVVLNALKKRKHFLYESNLIVLNFHCEDTYFHITYLLHGTESFLRSWPVCSKSRNSSRFIEPEGSLPHSQLLATCLYPEPAQSNPYPTSHFLNIHPNIILPSTPGSTQWPLSLRFLYYK